MIYSLMQRYLFLARHIFKNKRFLSQYTKIIMLHKHYVRAA